MKKVLKFICIMSLLIIAACSSDSTETKVEAKPTVPYGLYVHTDGDGCEYLVVYSREEYDVYNGGGLGIGVGITAKVNQPDECTLNE